MTDFRIINREILSEVIFRIFDKYPLLTSKYYDYSKLKKAYETLENKSLSLNVKKSIIIRVKKRNKI